MLEEETNVEQEVVQPEQENVTEEIVQPQETSVESEVAITDTPPAEVTAVPSDVDEFGVPFKNRYMEMKRKYEDVSSKQDQILQKMDNLQGQQQQPKHSKEELMAYISKEDTEPAHRAWALTEMNKLEEQNVSDKIEQKFQILQKQQTAERVKNDTFAFVTQRHPEITIKDNAGNFVGWNTKSPVVQRMDAYMRNPEIANNPAGLRVALALAKDDLSGSQLANQQKLKTQVKTLQKGTMVEGGKPSPIQTTDKLHSAKDMLRKSGSKKDALSAVAEWHRKQGKFEE